MNGISIKSISNDNDIIRNTNGISNDNNDETTANMDYNIIIKQWMNRYK